MGKLVLKKEYFKRNIHGFYFLEKDLGSKNPMIFMKMHISFRNFAHSKDFLYYILKRRNFQRGKRKHFFENPFFYKKNLLISD